MIHVLVFELVANLLQPVKISNDFDVPQVRINLTAHLQNQVLKTEGGGRMI
jgi:hypothetical protein